MPDWAGSCSPTKPIPLVKDFAAAEEHQPIQAKGFKKPVRTYRVADALGDLVERGRILRKEKAGLSLRVDLDKQDKAAAMKAVEDFLSELKT